jgi:hypothetical protein
VVTTDPLYALGGVLLTAGVYLLATARRRPSLTERLRPYHVRGVGDEAEEWLRGGGN